jgi:hypothetical protein
MARDMITWCDPCSDRNERVEGLTRRIDIGSGLHEVDMCDDCHDEQLKPLEELVLAHGRSIDVGPSLEKVGCPFCDRKLTSMRNLAKHVDNIHSSMAEAFVNTMLGSDSRSRTTTSAPPTVEHAARTGRTAPLDCPECGKVCHGPQGLAAHIKWHKSDTQNCPECGESMRSSVLPTHRAKAHGVPGKSRAAKAS